MIHDARYLDGRALSPTELMAEVTPGDVSLQLHAPTDGQPHMWGVDYGGAGGGCADSGSAEGGGAKGGGADGGGADGGGADGGCADGGSAEGGGVNGGSACWESQPALRPSPQLQGHSSQSGKPPRARGQAHP